MAFLNLGKCKAGINTSLRNKKEDGFRVDTSDIQHGGRLCGREKSICSNIQPAHLKKSELVSHVMNHNTCYYSVQAANGTSVTFTHTS